MTVFLECRR